MLRKITRGNENYPTLYGLDDFVHSMIKGFDPLLPSETMWDTGAFAKIEIEVQEKTVLAKLPLPGCSMKDFAVELEHDILTVSVCRDVAQKKDGNPAEESKASAKKKNMIRKECSFTESYQQSIRIPVPVFGDQAKAEYRDGILSVMLPRDTEEKKPIHVIEVKGGKA